MSKRSKRTRSKRPRTRSRGLKLCPSCNRRFPGELIQDMAISERGGDLRYERKCPLCALKFRNAMHGLPPDEPFTGRIARQMYDQAIAFLKQQEQEK